MSFWGVLPPKFRGTSFRLPKGTSLRDFTSFELSCVKIHPRVWPMRVPEKKGINKNNFLLYFTHLPRNPQWVDLYQIWYRRSPRGCNQLCRVFCRLVQGYWFCRRLKFAYHHRNWRSPLTLSELPFRLWWFRWWYFLSYVRGLWVWLPCLLLLLLGLWHR